MEPVNKNNYYGTVNEWVATFLIIVLVYRPTKGYCMMF